jgi:hypothetical protein
MLWIALFALIISIIAIVVSVISWRKSRAIYAVERKVMRQITGAHDDMYINEQSLNEKLHKGEWTILDVLERSKSDGDWEVLLGRIKKK